MIVFFLTQATNQIPIDIINRALETAGFSFLAGILVGVFTIVKWLDIPDKLIELNSKLEKISNRQKRFFEILYRIQNNDEKSGKSFIMDEFDTETN